jgi:hypothetical protein
LPPKFRSRESSIAQREPKLALGVGHRAPQGTSA